MPLQQPYDFDSKRDMSTVISMLPIALREVKPGLIPSDYHIPACRNPMSEVETLVVMRARFPVYIDENRPCLVVPEPSDLLAASICRDFKVSVDHFQPGVSEPGLFWVSGAYRKQDITNTENLEMLELVNRERAKQLEWFKLLVKKADDDWSRYHIRKMISDLQMLAASAIKVQREWMMELEIGVGRSIPCKFCRADIHPEAIICSHCRGVVNMERFKKEFQAVPAQ